MKNPETTLPETNKRPFLWISVISLGIAIALARLNIYLGTQVHYLDYLLFFNALTIAMLMSAGIAMLLSIAGLWRARFKSISLALMSLTPSVFLILLFLID